MAKICYLTGEPVLYIDCLECEKKEYCRKKKKKKLMVVIPDGYSRQDVIYSELDSFFKRIPVDEILSREEDKERILGEYADKNELKIRSFPLVADEKSPYFSRMKHMIASADILLIFHGGTPDTTEIIKEANRQHKRGKVIKLEPIITIPELSDAFFYAALVFFPDKDLMTIYRHLLLYLKKKGFFVTPVFDTDITDQMFKSVEYAREEPKFLQKILIEQLNISRIFRTKELKKDL